MKEAVTEVTDTLTQEDFHGALEKLLERYNKCIAAGGDYFEGDESFMCVLSTKVPIRKKVWKPTEGTTPPLGQDMTQGQIFKQSLTGLNSSFPSPRLVASLSRKNLVCPTIYP